MPRSPWRPRAAPESWAFPISARRGEQLPPRLAPLPHLDREIALSKAPEMLSQDLSQPGFMLSQASSPASRNAFSFASASTTVLSSCRSALPSSDPAEAIIEERAVSERLAAIRSGDGGGRRPFSDWQAGRHDERRNAEQCRPPDRLSSREGAGQERTFRDCPGHSALSVNRMSRHLLEEPRSVRQEPKKRHPKSLSATPFRGPGSAAAPGRRGPRAGRGARDGTLTGTAQGERRWHGNRPWTDHRQARPTHHCLLTL
jgi:hypothetical protein